MLSQQQAQQARALLETPGSPRDAALRARWMMDRARLAFALKQPNGPALMHAALEAAVASGDASLTCTLRLRLAEIAADLNESETGYRAALAEARRMQDAYLEAWAEVDLGFVRAKASRFDEAIPWLDMAHDHAASCGARSLLSAADGNLGWAYLMLGDSDRALDAFTRAEAVSAQIGNRDVQQRWLGGIGNIYMIQGDLVRAESYQQRALALARVVHNDGWEAIALTNLAQISLDRGDALEARTFNDQALAIKRRSNDPWSLVYSELMAAEIEGAAGHARLAESAYRKVIEDAPAAQAPDVLWQADGWLAALYEKTGRPTAAEAQYRETIGAIDRQWDKLRGDDWKTTFLALRTLIGFFQDYVDFLVAHGETEKALEVAESSRARVLSQRLEHLGKVPPNFQIGKLLAATRASHTVVLSYWLGGPSQSRSSVWVIGSGRLSRFDLPPAKEIAGLVRKYSETVTHAGDPLAGHDAVAAALYQAVLAPAAKIIPRGSDVIIVPDGALHELNFETLVVPTPQPHYWIEDVAIATAPSLRVLEGGGRQPARAPALLLLGDPVLTGQEFPPLPNVKKEIAAVRGQFPADRCKVITGAGAIARAYAQALPANYTNIHFATHATANLESPLNSAIILSHQGENYKLYARDVAKVPLTADLVTISACHSAGAKAYAGEGLMGFAWAFLQSGAQNVIATLWDEDDAASVDLMRCLYAGIAAGQSPARALRAAKLPLLHSPSNLRLPYYWGPLEVFTRRM